MHEGRWLVAFGMCMRGARDRDTRTDDQSSVHPHRLSAHLDSSRLAHDSRKTAPRAETRICHRFTCGISRAVASCERMRRSGSFRARASLGRSDWARRDADGASIVSSARIRIIASAGKRTIRVSSFPFVVVAGPAIYPGETGIDDPQRAKKRWFHEGIRDVPR